MVGGDLDDTLMAVMAHGLLTAMSVVTGSIGLLRDAWDEIDPEEETRAVLAGIAELSDRIATSEHSLENGQRAICIRTECGFCVEV